MKVVDALTGITRLEVDTAPFIYYAEDHAKYASRMDNVFKQLETGQLQIITVSITLTEVLTKPIVDGNINLINQYRTMLRRTDAVMLISIDPEIAERAGYLRAQYRLKTSDALQIAAAIQADCDAFLINDFVFRRANNEIPILILDQLETDDNTRRDTLDHLLYPGTSNDREYV